MGISVIDNHLSGINFANEFCCAIFTLVALAALLLLKHHNKEIRAFIYFCFCSAAALWTDVISYMCAGNTGYIGLMYAVNAASYGFTAFAACTFYLYIMVYFEERSIIKYKTSLKVAAIIYTAICSIIYASSVFTKDIFYIDSQGIYHTGDYSIIIAYLILPLNIVSAVLIIRGRKYTSKRDTNLHFLYILTYTALGSIDTKFTVSLHYIVMTILVILIVIFIALERDKQIEIKKKELAISELNALRLQMNPHFIYNTLASIDGLVDIDPDSARSLISKFTKHLRSSYLDNSPTYVSFEKEIENIKCYLAVEEVRFPDIKVEYNLATTDFNIPPLTVQPIIENAIKHGICKKDDSAGTITISSYDDSKNNYLSITDDGVGFDTSAPIKNDTRTHIGLANAGKRLELICNGSLAIKSEPGIGTEVLITIPKETA